MRLDGAGGFVGEDLVLPGGDRVAGPAMSRGSALGTSRRAVRSVSMNATWRAVTIVPWSRSRTRIELVADHAAAFEIS